MLYACSSCCSKVQKKGEPCAQCHNGVGIQVDPVPEDEEQKSTNMCKGVPRLCKRPPVFFLDAIETLDGQVSLDDVLDTADSQSFKEK